MGRAGIVEGLSSEQRRAVEAVRGPVCILAGAGSGKTTTITRRIANQVSSGTFPAESILAVTFTDRAAGEMRTRLAALGVDGVEARTFHSAALRQLRAFGANPPEQILPSKAIPLRQIGNGLPGAYRFRPAGDLASEVEWAKNRRIRPADYLDSLGDHEPPIPADLMAGVLHRYEREKHKRGMVDFEDLLELAIRMFDEQPASAAAFRERVAALTVDEYQDANLLQQTLLERWLGGRDDLCVVGDDYQAIYSFTGASPSHLLEMPSRYPGAVVVRLEENHRSTPQVLELANRLVPGLGGVGKILRATHPDGPEPLVRAFNGPEDEAAFVVAHARELHAAEGVPYESMAVLYRANFRSEDFEEAFVAAGVPFQVRDGSFLSRPAARRLLSRVGPSSSIAVASLVRAAAEADGLVEEPPEGLGDQEATRQADLARLVRLAEEFDDGIRTVEDFAADLRARFSADGAGRGVNLLTYHRAKGLEFDVVFLPRLEEGELPFRRATTDEALAEERRLLYVGITRARRHLVLSWTVGGRSSLSRFLDELGLRSRPAPGAAGPRRARNAASADPLLTALRTWRLNRSRQDRVPAYVVCHDATLEEIARVRPRDWADLAGISGIGPAKLDRYADDILDVLARQHDRPS